MLQVYVEVKRYNGDILGLTIDGVLEDEIRNDLYDGLTHFVNKTLQEQHKYDLKVEVVNVDGIYNKEKRNGLLGEV